MTEERIGARNSPQGGCFVGVRRPRRSGGGGRTGKMRSDVEIARAARPKPITEIAAAIGAPESALHPFGRSIAKLEYDFLEGLASRPDGKLILVPAISPTPAGEGKTTTTIGPRDAMNLLGRETNLLLPGPLTLSCCFPE